MTIYRLKFITTILLLGFFLGSCVSPLIVTNKNLILYQIEVNGKSGYIDQKGKVRIEPIYDICSFYDDECNSEQVFYWLKNEESFIVKKKGKFGLINYKGEQITDFIFDEMSFSIGNNFDVGIDNKYGMIDSQGSDLVPIIFSSPYFISADSTFSCKMNNEIGLYNNSTGYFLALEYYDISPFHKGLGSVTTKSGMHGMINSNGDLVIDTIYEDMETFYTRNLLAVQSNEGWNYINHNGNVVINGDFSKAELFWGDYAIVQQNEKYGIIDTLGNFIIEPKYEYLNYTGGSLIKFGDSKFPGYGNVGLLNFSGDTILNNEYDHTMGFAGYAEVFMNNKYGVIKLDTKEVVIPFNFYYVDYDNIDLTLLRFHDSKGNSYMGYINKKMKIIWTNNEPLLTKLLDQ